MKLKMFFIACLLAAVASAPVVDALACDDCKVKAPLREAQRCSEDCSVRSGCSLLPSDEDLPDQRGAEAAQDLCPVCANSAATAGAASFGAPAMSIDSAILPMQIAFSDPSYSIIKPPQN